MVIHLPYTCDMARAMIFVDGENLAIRYGSMLKEQNRKPRPDIECEPNVFVWFSGVSPAGRRSGFGDEEILLHSGPR
jgi:hypothetical protein